MALTCVAALGAAPQRAAASAPPNTLTVKFGENLALEYERAVRPDVSIFIGPALAVGFTNFNHEFESELGIGSVMGARFFLSGEAPAGLFMSPFIDLSYYATNARGTHISGLRLKSGGMLGYTWIFGRRFVVSAGVGATYADITGGPFVKSGGPVEGTLRFAMGVAF